MKPILIFLFIYTISFNSLLLSIIAIDTLVVNQTIRDGQTIISAQQTFELGFFSPSNTTQNRYLGIWYKRLAKGTVAWVANRETPIRNKSGQLTLHPDGILVLLDSSTNKTIWSSDLFGTIRDPVARLLDSGNLIVINKEEGRENYIWQSFDHPTDTFLPGMKFGRNLERGVVTNFTSWKSIDDPSQGPFMVYMDFNGLSQIFQKNGDEIQYRLGSWNGFTYTGYPSYKPNPLYKGKYVSNENEIYETIEMTNASVPTKLTITPTGTMEILSWFIRTQGWFFYSTPATDNCVRYGLCGVYGNCDIEQSPSCTCLKGFTPKNPNMWEISDWRGGCRREIPLDCGVQEGFRKYSFLKLPDTRKSWYDTNMTLAQCELKCRNECNCTAYTTLDIKYGSGCLIWYDDLIDIRLLPNNGQDIYMRMAAAELEKDRKASGGKTKRMITIISVTVGFTILLAISLLIIVKRKLNAQGRHAQVAQKDVLELPLFSLSSLLDATNNFSEDHKLGEGGFGPVYKGVLSNGIEIGVKRLSVSSSQGIEEFKNEVIFISKLQHRNLVKILGCCTEGQERLLVYEYMPNKGLDLFLFNETKSKMLDWPQRHHIINGIARGLLYLHQDSRLRIIHRDLKAANILLDRDMNPKISDFGLARSFGENEMGTNTQIVAGTYGYMSPEYAGNGIFSVKSDVFSFGVLVLEIVSGKKNRGFIHQDHNHNLLGHAWKLYKENKSSELADISFTKSCNLQQVTRSIQVALLCVQHNPNDRPNMAMVVMMLGSDNELFEPKQPGFYIEDNKFGPETTHSMQVQNRNIEVTHSLLEPR